MLFLECLDFVRMLQREADFVQTIQQTMLAERIDIERERFSGRDGYQLLLQIDEQSVPFGSLDLAEQLIHL